MFNNEYAYIKEGQVFRKGFRDFPDKQIGEIKTDEAESIAYFQNKYGLAVEKVEMLEKEVEAAENKGSFLMRLIHLKEHLTRFDAIGDFDALYTRLENLEEQLKTLIASNRVNNLTIKRKLIAEAEALEGSENWKEDTEKFKDLKNRWIKTGNVEKEYEEELNHRFSSIVDVFFAKRQAFYKEQHRQIQNKLFQLKQILKKARASARKPSYAAINELRMLQEEWKRVGKVPNKATRALSKEFEEICNKALKQNGGFTRNREEGEVTEIIKEKERMIEKAKMLSTIQAPSAAHIEEVYALQSAWKQKKIIPQEQNKALAKAFYNACNLVLERSFIINLAQEKFKDFSELSTHEKLKIKIQLTGDLLARDERELRTFQENLEKVNTSANDTNKLVNARFNQQVRKVFIKKKLLEAFKKEVKEKIS